MASLMSSCSSRPSCASCHQDGAKHRSAVSPERALASEGVPLPTDTAERVSALFANWLNAQLRDPLPMGDPEFLEWRNRMYEEIKAEEREGRHED